MGTLATAGDWTYQILEVGPELWLLGPGQFLLLFFFFFFFFFLLS